MTNNEKAKKALKILDKNGFDWWGFKKLDFDFKLSYNGKIVILFFKMRKGVYNGREVFSKADIATNKSAIMAICKKAKNVCRGCPECGSPACVGFDVIQYKLIYDITHNNCKDFWDILLKFVGGE